MKCLPGKHVAAFLFLQVKYQWVMAAYCMTTQITHKLHGSPGILPAFVFIYITKSTNLKKHAFTNDSHGVS